MNYRKYGSLAGKVLSVNWRLVIHIS